MAHIARYVAAKHGVVGLMRTLAQELAPSICVNSVHPTQVDTDTIHNEVTYQRDRPDLESPTREDFMCASATTNLLGVPWVESRDVSNAVLFLASEEARYITGVTLPVDGGCWPADSRPVDRRPLSRRRSALYAEFRRQSRAR